MKSIQMAARTLLFLHSVGATTDALLKAPKNSTALFTKSEFFAKGRNGIKSNDHSSALITAINKEAAPARWHQDVLNRLLKYDVLMAVKPDDGEEELYETRVDGKFWALVENIEKGGILPSSILFDSDESLENSMAAAGFIGPPAVSSSEPSGAPEEKEEEGDSVEEMREIVQEIKEMEGSAVHKTMRALVGYVRDIAAIDEAIQEKLLESRKEVKDAISDLTNTFLARMDLADKKSRQRFEEFDRKLSDRIVETERHISAGFANQAGNDKVLIQHGQVAAVRLNELHTTIKAHGEADERRTGLLSRNVGELVKSLRKANQEATLRVLAEQAEALIRHITEVTTEMAVDAIDERKDGEK